MLGKNKLSIRKVLAEGTLDCKHKWFAVKWERDTLGSDIGRTREGQIVTQKYHRKCEVCGREEIISCKR